ncbi:dimethylhistidine N-methyltransferase [Neolewinella xylanilytica]|uniref:Dimethylhistidine N-methyltransferase n=1 Tax=Neolewinella xylanilytica TaxID=1514080 RepID=A0A2S6I2I6_9BACT|nr:L-histidine N(alpha)-methyltransferase [Neolewinella xylanilytica]PPK85396.1 dimethylhistidine N-methyltransferase [Neolewinella xylanilytica]
MTVSHTSPTLSTFADDVVQHLSGERPRLNSKWFYDEQGNTLFQSIMQTQEYYLTDAEKEIYGSCGKDLLRYLDRQPFDLIELGAGDGTKTQHLIERLLAEKARFAYRPIDLNGSALEELSELINFRWPKLDFEPIQADYFEALNRLGNSSGGRRRLLLFPGANIGNYTPGEAVDMLKRLRQFLAPGDMLLTGFDLKKDPAVILAAYNDAAGYTAAFNLNLLTRINRELKADFVLDCWRHWETYDPVTGAAKSYLIPIEPQTVHIGAAGRSFNFRAWQPVEVEISQKYSLREIEGMADAAGFEFVRHFQDSQQYFTDSLWRVANH